MKQNLAPPAAKSHMQKKGGTGGAELWREHWAGGWEAGVFIPGSALYNPESNHCFSWVSVSLLDISEFELSSFLLIKKLFGFV